MGAPVLAAMRGHRVSGVNVARVLDLAKAELCLLYTSAGEQKPFACGAAH